ncbi:hypothetical protein HUB97_05535 [Halorubraceae archaeon YAN]|nr:hypothetical protein [Halorubraceae archaeon YAN]
MERTPQGTPVGVDDPYAVAGHCDHLTSDGRCRYALEYAGHDPAFAQERAAEEYRCHVGADECWRDCPHYRWTTDDRECARCGLEEIPIANEPDRPLLEEHHLSYGNISSDDQTLTHELTVSLCRWCHAKVHNSFARIDDDVSPDLEAIAEKEARRTKEQHEFGFQSALDRSKNDKSRY